MRYFKYRIYGSLATLHKELKFALDYEKFVKVLPLRVDDTYPPEPPGWYLSKPSCLSVE